MAKFQKGQPRPAGAGRRLGQAGKRPRRFYALLDDESFSLKKEVRKAIVDRDPEWTKALAQLLKALDAGAPPAAEAAESDDMAKLLELAGQQASA